MNSFLSVSLGFWVIFKDISMSVFIKKCNFLIRRSFSIFLSLSMLNSRRMNLALIMIGILTSFCWLENQMCYCLNIKSKISVKLKLFLSKLIRLSIYLNGNKHSNMCFLQFITLRNSYKRGDFFTSKQHVGPSKSF